MLHCVAGLRSVLARTFLSAQYSRTSTSLPLPHRTALNHPLQKMARATPTSAASRRASSRTTAAAVTADTSTGKDGNETIKAASPTVSIARSKRKAADSASATLNNGVNNASKEAADQVDSAAPSTPAKKSRKKAISDSDSPSAPKSEDTTADPSLPKNTEMPATLSYARPTAPGCIRITSWNITSLKSSEAKGMMRYIQAEDADIVVLSETKVNDVPMHPGLTKIYKHQYWGVGKQKGYAGLAILSKIEPLKAVYGLPGLKDQDTKGRISKSIASGTRSGHPCDY